MSPTATFFLLVQKEYGKKNTHKGDTTSCPPYVSPRADKVTTLHLRTSANYCLCMAIIPPRHCRHFVGGSVLRFKGPLAKGAVMRSMTGGLAGGL